MAANEPSGLLRLRRTDNRDSIAVVLIYSRGNKALELELIASEGESAWAVTLKENVARNSKAANNQASDAVWEATLRAALLLEKPKDELAPELEGLEAVWTIAKDGNMSLIFRRNIGELTQRLGTITLEPTGDDKFDLWAGCAAGGQLIADSRKQANELEDKLAAQQEANRKLEEQLQELIKAKEEHEDALLHKFTQLINAKKLKIRDQQRILATAKVDPEKAEKAQGINASRTPEESRTSKRKAATTNVASEDESSDGFEDAPDEDEPMRDASTPEPAEDLDETDDEDDEAVPTPPPEPKKGIRRNLASKAKDPESTKPNPASQSSKPQNVSQEPKKSEEPPPRRELPFARRKAAQEAEKRMSQDDVPSQAPSTSTVANAADDDTTDDDEL